MVVGCHCFLLYLEPLNRKICQEFITTFSWGLRSNWIFFNLHDFHWLYQTHFEMDLHLTAVKKYTAGTLAKNMLIIYWGYVHLFVLNGLEHRIHNTTLILHMSQSDLESIGVFMSDILIYDLDTIPKIDKSTLDWIWSENDGNLLFSCVWSGSNPISILMKTWYILQDHNAWPHRDLIVQQKLDKVQTGIASYFIRHESNWTCLGATKKSCGNQKILQIP